MVGLFLVLIVFPSFDECSASRFCFVLPGILAFSLLSFVMYDVCRWLICLSRSKFCSVGGSNDSCFGGPTH